MYSGSLSYDADVESSGLASGSSMGSGDAGVGGIASGWSGSGVSGGEASTKEVSYATMMRMNSRKTMRESRESKKALEGLYAAQIVRNAHNRFTH